MYFSMGIIRHVLLVQTSRLVKFNFCKSLGLVARVKLVGLNISIITSTGDCDVSSAVL